jgi:hypothetical protein
VHEVVHHMFESGSGNAVIVFKCMVVSEHATWMRIIHTTNAHEVCVCMYVVVILGEWFLTEDTDIHSGH